MVQEATTVSVAPRKVIKTLAVGQEVEGVVKRVTDFGAFVDIGVGRDGLVHVSEMAQGRVNRAADVVQEGARVRVWVKELDREKNRISLTMVEPGVLSIHDLEEGAVVTGKVTRIESYGAFVDIGVGRDGMLHVKEMGHGHVERPEDVVRMGEEIRVQVMAVDRQRRRVDLSIKALLSPPDQDATHAIGTLRPQDEELASPDDQVEFISPFELAFQEANRADDRRRERRKKDRIPEVEDDEDDDLIRRTIAHHRKSKGL